MPRPYSNDLRARVIEAIESGASRREAAELCSEAKRRQHLSARKHSEWLPALVAEQPDLTLSEMVAAMRKRRHGGMEILLHHCAHLDRAAVRAGLLLSAYH
jgi:hypothetical protein